MKASRRPARRATSVSSALASPKRTRSAGSRTNARTTRMPAICSRSTRLTPSISFWICRNSGTMRLTTTLIEATSTATLTTISQDSPRSSRSAMKTPPTHMIGADTMTVQVSRTSICTCCTSLVVRVIRDGAPKALTSRAEKVPTRWKTAARTSLPKPSAVRAPNHTAATVAATCTSVTTSITMPTRRM